MKTILFSIGLILTLAGKSQDSLLFYLSEAAKNNPTVLQKYTEYQAALQKVPQVGSLPDPELSMGVFLSPMELVSGNQVADLRLMQMFPWFGTLRAAKDEMSLMANAKYESFRDAKLQVFYEVQRTWYELHKVKQNIRISEENIEILHTIERLAIVRFKAAPPGNGSSTPGGGMSTAPGQGASTGSSGMQSMGGSSGNSTVPVSNQASSPLQASPMGSSTGSAGSLSDVYRIQIEISDLQNNIALLKNQWNTTSALFNSYLDRPPDSPVFLPDTLIADSFLPPIMTVSDTMLANNPMLGMLQYEQQSLEARKQMVTRMGYPMIGLGVDYSIISKNSMSTSAMNGKDMIMPMVTATIPIYRKKYKAMRTEADLLDSATAQDYKATANSLKNEYYQATQLYLDAQRRMKLFLDQSNLTKQTLDIMLLSYSSGVPVLTDILRIRQQLLDYQLKEIESVADYNTAIAWLKRLTTSSNTEN